MTYIYPEPGCKVLVNNPTSTHYLDICNCSLYYFLLFGSQKEGRVCPQGQLFNHKLGGCEREDKVLTERLCNRKTPWERCAKDTLASRKLQIKNKCISVGKYSETVAAKYDDRLAYQYATALPNDVVLSNLGLAAAAFVAGCVVTLIFLLMIITICKVPWFGYNQSGSKSVKTVTKKKKTRTVVTEGDNVSVSYEDIDEGKHHNQEGYLPMFSGDHLQLQGGSNTGRPDNSHIHTVSSSVTVSTSSNVQPSHGGRPSKPPPAPFRFNNTSRESGPKRPLPGAGTREGPRGKGPLKVPPKPGRFP